MKTRRHNDYKKPDARQSDEADSFTSADKSTESLSNNKVTVGNAAQHSVSNKNKRLGSCDAENYFDNDDNSQFLKSSYESDSDQMCRMICKSLFKSIKERHYSLSSSFLNKYEATAYDDDDEFDLSEFDSETFQQKIEALSPPSGHIMDSLAAQASEEELQKYEILYEIIMKKQNLDPSEKDLSVSLTNNNNQKIIKVSAVEHKPISLGKLSFQNAVLKTRRSPETRLQKRITMSTKTEERNIQHISHSSMFIKKDSLSPKSSRTHTRSSNNSFACHRSKQQTAQQSKISCQKISREFKDPSPNNESERIFSDHDLKQFYSWTCKRFNSCTTMSPRKRLKRASGDDLTRELEYSPYNLRKTPTSIESRQSPQKVQPKASGAIFPFKFEISKAPWFTNRNYVH